MFQVIRHPLGFAVSDSRGEVVDVLSTERVAEHFARRLNAGAAKVSPHAMLGQRIDTWSVIYGPNTVLRRSTLPR